MTSPNGLCTAATGLHIPTAETHNQSLMLPAHRQNGTASTRKLNKSGEHNATKQTGKSIKKLNKMGQHKETNK
jgi:hypothetical protein